MKEFACGDVVPGCEAHFVAATEEEILALVAPHAAEAHDIDPPTEALVEAVRANIATT